LMPSVYDVVGDPLSEFLKVGSVWCKCIKKQFWKVHDLIIYLKKRWAQWQTQNLADIMSLDCQLEKIKANKSMLRQTKLVYILKTTGAS
jgi:hypothetical protein